DFVTVKGDGNIDIEYTFKALEAEGIDTIGLDSLDRKFIKIIIEYYNGGPVGIEALAATLNEETDTLVDVVEPYLLKIGFLQRTKRGRMVSKDAIKHLGLKTNGSGQASLFE
ncbi:MAG: Holliday junction DNA helicase RuvB C-terminal domain-containing protein, partial [Candidatus Zixiibacteriota bacterium]